MENKDEMELTDCYKCGSEITAHIYAVHPLCDSCENGFNKWFGHEIAKLDKQVS